MPTLCKNKSTKPDKIKPLRHLCETLILLQ